jgi:predicted RNase H-like nuclease (RuvC/YqgF family)
LGLKILPAGSKKRSNPWTKRAKPVNAMLLNEFLKEHKAFVEEQREVEQQQKEIDALKTELKEQRALIEKVNDKMEPKASASQTTANNQ